MSSSIPDVFSIREPTVAPDVAVQVSDLRMRYGSNDVLHGVNFTIRRGEVLVLLGPNGAGKTTTIEILEGFRVPSAGEITVLGENPATAAGGSGIWGTPPALSTAPIPPPPGRARPRPTS